MATDIEKIKLSKVLQGLEIQELKLPERCNGLLKDIQQKISEEMKQIPLVNQEKEIRENPYRVDRGLLEKYEEKLRELQRRNKCCLKQPNITEKALPTDSNKPWRTNNCKEKLHRIDKELKFHTEKSTNMIMPLTDEVMKDLIKECKECPSEPTVYIANKIRATVEAARNELPNFQYRKIENSTAAAILQDLQHPFK